MSATPPATAGEDTLAAPTPGPAGAAEGLERPRPAPSLPAASPGAQPDGQAREPGEIRPRWPSLDAQTARIRAQIQDWTFEDYRNWLSRRSSLSGEDAYQAWRFTSACVGAVTDESELLRRSEQYREYARYNPAEVSDERLSRALEQIERSFVHCEGMGDEVLQDAIEWLQLAADLDYLPAQIEFADDLPTLLQRVPWTPFRHPEMVELYRDQAPLLLERAMASGHPDAYRAQSRALDRGLAYDRDPVAAAAYERLAARLLLGHFVESANGRGLSADQRRAAADLADRLCQRFCP